MRFLPTVVWFVHYPEFMMEVPIVVLSIFVLLLGSPAFSSTFFHAGISNFFLLLPVLGFSNLDDATEVLVLVPTRELADQVSTEIYNLGKILNIEANVTQ